MTAPAHPISLDELPERMRLLALQLQQVGESISYHGGVGPFGEWGRLLTEQTAPMCHQLATRLEQMRSRTH